jgi:hypothetical protein
MYDLIGRGREAAELGRSKSVRERRARELLLVDLDADPGEHRNVVARRPEIAVAHARRMDELAVRRAASGATPSALTREYECRLRALGYLE